MPERFKSGVEEQAEKRGRLATPEDLERRKAFYTGEKRSVNLKNPEAWNSLFGEWGVNSISPNISIPTAQRLSIVFTCLNVLGETRGSLPCDVMRNTDKGNIAVPQDPIHRLVHDRPNAYMTAFTFWSTIEKLKKAWGNAYAEIERDSNEVPVALWIRYPWLMTFTILPGGREVYYHYEGRDIRNTDMLHFKNYSMDGYLGISSIKQNALAINTGLKLKEYNNNLIGERSWGYLYTDAGKPKDLTTKANMQGLWSGKTKDEDQATVRNPQTGIQEKVNMGSFGTLPLLYGGVKFQSLALPADDVAYIETAQMTNVDIYGIFRVPPTFGQDWEHTPYNGAEQQDLIFAKYTLASIRDDEQEMNEKLFPETNKTSKEPLYIKFNLKGLLMGDHKSRQEFYSKLFAIGVFSPNMILEMEDLPHYPDGDKRYIQGAYVPVDQISELVGAQIKKGDRPEPKEPPKEQKSRDEIMAEIRHLLKGKLNGSYKDVEQYLQ